MINAEVDRVATQLAKGDAEAYPFLWSAAKRLQGRGEPLNDSRVLAEAKRLRESAEAAHRRNALRRERWKREAAQQAAWDEAHPEEAEVYAK